MYEYIRRVPTQDYTCEKNTEYNYRKGKYSRLVNIWKLQIREFKTLHFVVFAIKRNAKI